MSAPSSSKKIVAIGKNYEAHAREMGATSAPKDPLFFLKPTSRWSIVYVASGFCFGGSSCCICDL